MPDHNINQMKFYNICTEGSENISRQDRIVWRPDIVSNSSDKDQEVEEQSNLSLRSVCSRDEISTSPEKLFVIGDID